MARSCTHCGRGGHNRRTCPHISDEYKKIVNRGHRKNKVRSCSFCKNVQHHWDEAGIIRKYQASKYSKHADIGMLIDDSGYVRWGAMRDFGKTHNKRTCPIRKVVIAARAEEERVAWNKVFAEMADKGVGYGTMIMSRSYDDDQGEYVDVLGWIIGTTWGDADDREPTFQIQHLNPKFNRRDLSWAWVQRKIRKSIEARQDSGIVSGKPIKMPASFKEADHPFFYRRATDFIDHSFNFK